MLIGVIHVIGDGLGEMDGRKGVSGKELRCGFCDVMVIGKGCRFSGTSLPAVISPLHGFERIAEETRFDDNVISSDVIGVTLF